VSLELSPPARALRRLELLAIGQLFRLPPRMKTWLSGKPGVVVEGLALHPDMQLLISARAWRNGRGFMRSREPAAARASMRREALWYSNEGPPIGAVTDRTIAGPAGPLRARLYRSAEPSGPHPLIVFFHGGGFVTGDLDTHDEACRWLCHDAGANVLAVEYRLAPEHRFPAAVEDAVAAFRWAAEHAAELGADPSRLGVAGDSAGGNLAAVVAQLCAGDGGPAPSLQVLVYPKTDQRQQHRSLQLFADGFFLTRADIDWFDESYLGPRGEHRLDPRASPALAADLGKLCRAIVVTAGFDPLRDEGDEYAALLERAGVPTTLLRFEGMIHGFINMGSVSPRAREAWSEVGRQVRAAFG